MAESIGTALRSTSEKAKGILGEAGASRRDEGGTKEGRRRTSPTGRYYLAKV